MTPQRRYSCNGQLRNHARGHALPEAVTVQTPAGDGRQARVHAAFDYLYESLRLVLLRADFSKAPLGRLSGSKAWADQYA